MYKNSMNSYHHSIYWLPKLHKNLMAPGSLLLQINALQNSFHHYLLLVLKQYLLVINNIVMVYNHSGINCFWIINNSTEVLDRLHQINKTLRARQFDIYNFATLYTNTPHNALKENIRSLACLRSGEPNT